MTEKVKVCREPTPPYEMESIRKAFSSDFPPCSHPQQPLFYFANDGTAQYARVLSLGSRNRFS
jgi:hypothetical protein